jgi:hypothetical protein
MLLFSGVRWWVKTSGGQAVGPGPTVFSDSTETVAVDEAGRLHLRIIERAGRSTGAEVVSECSFGYGTYAWEVVGPIVLDANVVLGLFTWSDDPAYAHREIDIELGQWSNPADPTNSQYVVQPWQPPGNLQRFTLPLATPGSLVLSFTWRPDAVHFESRDAAGVRLSCFTYTGPDIPRPGDEQARINLWLNDGLPPSDGQEVHVTIASFRFTPLISAQPASHACGR